jgi:endonuclease/exonuclease/phosphatase family metal-dependent hydrolase
VPPGPNEQPLRILTNNIGQSNRQSIKPFVNAEDPDVLALQDAKGRGYRYVARYPKYHVASRGEFILISRYRVGRSGLVKIPNVNANPVAAWFELEFHGRTIRVYNVHLPTPRTELGRVRGLGMVKELLRPYVKGPGYQGWSYRKALQQRRALVEGLANVLAEEQLPCIVAGDFNLPDQGYFYSCFAKLLTDSFQVRGRGYGFTFPGTTRNPFTGFGPWLRVDYIFCSPEWKVLYCRTEPDRRSQHRAVAARLVLRGAEEE